MSFTAGPPTRFVKRTAAWDTTWITVAEFLLELYLVQLDLQGTTHLPMEKHAESQRGHSRWRVITLLNQIASRGCNDQRPLHATCYHRGQHNYPTGFLVTAH
jgi:hypothetical protein